MRVDSRLHPLPLAARRSSEPARRPAAEFAHLLNASQPAAAQAAPSASGAPQITLSNTPAPNPWNYQGPAARNPFYGKPVEGFENWFAPVHVAPAAGAQGGGYTMSRAYGATEEGAREALRLVQQYAPEAQLATDSMGGFWATDKPIYYVVLPGGNRLNAGLLLERYYQRGQGATAASDLELASELRQLTRAAT